MEEKQTYKAIKIWGILATQRTTIKVVIIHGEIWCTLMGHISSLGWNVQCVFENIIIVNTTANEPTSVPKDKDVIISFSHTGVSLKRCIAPERPYEALMLAEWNLQLNSLYSKVLPLIQSSVILPKDPGIRKRNQSILRICIMYVFFFKAFPNNYAFFPRKLFRTSRNNSTFRLPGTWSQIENGCQPRV